MEPCKLSGLAAVDDKGTTSGFEASISLPEPLDWLRSWRPESRLGWLRCGGDDADHIGWAYSPSRKKRPCTRCSERLLPYAHVYGIRVRISLLLPTVDTSRLYTDGDYLLIILRQLAEDRHTALFPEPGSENPPPAMLNRPRSQAPTHVLVSAPTSTLVVRLCARLTRAMSVFLSYSDRARLHPRTEVTGL